MSPIGEAVAVFARDRWRIDTTDGFVDRGGDGRLGMVGLSIDVLAVILFGVGAIDGDCSGEWIGLSCLESSLNTGGRSGVVACACSSE